MNKVIWGVALVSLVSLTNCGRNKTNTVPTQSVQAVTLNKAVLGNWLGACEGKVYGESKKVLVTEKSIVVETFAHSKPDCSSKGGKFMTEQYSYSLAANSTSNKGTLVLRDANGKTVNSEFVFAVIPPSIRITNNLAIPLTGDKESIEIFAIKAISGKPLKRGIEIAPAPKVAPKVPMIPLSK